MDKVEKTDEEVKILGLRSLSELLYTIVKGVYKNNVLKEEEQLINDFLMEQNILKNLILSVQ